MLELAPLCWERTRARLDSVALEKDFGPVTIPADPLDTRASAQQQSTTS